MDRRGRQRENKGRKKRKGMEKQKSEGKLKKK